MLPPPRNNCHGRACRLLRRPAPVGAMAGIGARLRRPIPAD